MIRARLTLLAAVLAASAACGSKGTAPARSNFRLPASVAAFRGITALSGQLRPYFAVANEGREDLTLIDARTNTVLDGPVLVRPLSVTFPGRPALLASADLGDRPATGTPTQADLLVGVASGSASVLQLVKTWATTPPTPTTVDSDPTTAFGAGGAVDLGADILAIATLPRDTTDPTTVGTARLAVALGGKKLAVVKYRRAADGVAIVKDSVVIHGLDFEPAGIAAVPQALAAAEDANRVYLATLDPLGAAGVNGVALLDVSQAAEPWPYLALDARGPTRLVMAARLRERVANGATTPTGGTATANDGTAFDGQPTVQRVYAVLDEAGCGPGARIDCGLVMLDPTKTTGGDAIPEDDVGGFMPYRAPIQIGARIVALAVSAPPEMKRTDANYDGSLMQVAIAADVPLRLTTAVGVAVTEGGTIEFLDLGRFKVVNTRSAPVDAAASVAQPSGTNRLWVQDPDTGVPPQGSDAVAVNAMVQLTPGFVHDNEIWTVGFQSPLPSLQQRAAEAWVDGTGVVLAVQTGSGTPGATSGRSFSEVARLYHPALGVHPGDIVAITAGSLQAAGVTACLGEVPAGTSADYADASTKEFEAVITALLPPSAAAPGGAVRLALRSRGYGEPGGPDDTQRGTGDNQNPPILPGWDTCWTAMTQALATGGVERLLVTFYAGSGTTAVPGADNALLLTGSQSGYAGRLRLGTTTTIAGPPTDPCTGRTTFPGTYALYYRRAADETDPTALAPDPADPTKCVQQRYPDWQYLDEDALAARCPLADWDGKLASYLASPALDCGGGAGCDRDVCEHLVLARKARRRHYLAENCYGVDGTLNTDCQARYARFPVAGAAAAFPAVNGPSLRLRVYHDNVNAPPGAGYLVRTKQSLKVTTLGGLAPLAFTPGGAVLQPRGAIAFDRSPFKRDDGTSTNDEGYRFLVVYPANMVADVSPDVYAPSAAILQ